MVKKSKQAPGRIPADLPEESNELDQAELTGAAQLEDAWVRAGSLEGQDVRELRLRGCIVEGVAFSGAQIRSARWRDARFVRCDFSNARILGLEGVRVEFVDCRLTGIKALESKMEDVLFAGTGRIDVGPVDGKIGDDFLQRVAQAVIGEIAMAAVG